MRVDLIGYRGLTPAGVNSSLLEEWRVGTILQAVAVRDAKTGQLWLELNGQRHPARVASGDDSGPTDGERMKVRVLRNHPVLALETLHDEVQESHAQAVGDALRRYAPKQQSPAAMLANLAWIAQSKSNTANLPRAVIDAATRLWHSLPDAEALQDPKQLQVAIERSGTFLEATLGSAAPSDPRQIATDLKALLLNLSRVLREHDARPAAARADMDLRAPLPSAGSALNALPSVPATLAAIDTPDQQLHELARQADGALARMTTVQLANSGSNEAAQPTVLVEIPVRHQERASVLRLKIERDGARQETGSGEDSWCVEAAMDLGAVGGLHARVTLNGQRIGVQLRAESPSIVEALSVRSTELETMLRAAGLEVDRIVCLHGMPATERHGMIARLLDVRA